MKKTLKTIVVFILTIVCCALCACSITNGQAKGIKSIEKTATNGLKDTYTITYTDGTISTFEVTNGQNGEQGPQGDSITVEDLFNRYLQENPNATYQDFLNSFLGASNEANVAIINKNLCSAVEIYCEATTLVQNMFESYYTTGVSVGSGVVYKIDADYTYFITNYHVVYSELDEDNYAKKIICYLFGSTAQPQDGGQVGEDGYPTYNYGNYAIECEVVGSSATADIAIIKAPTQLVKSINTNVEAITFAEEYHVGETAIAIGNPEGEGISVTEGIVSVDNEMIGLDVDGTIRNYRCIRIDTAIYHGSSGGGLFNTKGELIGITNAGDNTDQNVNYAVPIEIVKGAVDNIMYYASLGEKFAKKITVGVTVVSANSKYVYNEQTGYGKIKEDVIVYSITKGSICEQVGLLVNDCIKGVIINGETYSIDRNFHIGDILLKVKAGDVIAFSITREGSEITTTSNYTIQQTDLAKA